VIKNIIYFIGSVFLFFACMIAYGIILNARESNLSQILIEKGKNNIVNPRILIEKSRNSLLLYDSDDLIKSYKASLGNRPYNQKLTDVRPFTPIGKYKICSIDSSSKYHKMFRINYPNEHDAADAVKNGLISKSEYNGIVNENLKYGCTVSENYFGSELGIHGIGEYDFIFRNLPFVFNWTNGSIALSNKSIDELYSYIKIGTPVEIIE